MTTEVKTAPVIKHRTTKRSRVSIFNFVTKQLKPESICYIVRTSTELLSYDWRYKQVFIELVKNRQVSSAVVVIPMNDGSGITELQDITEISIDNMKFVRSKNDHRTSNTVYFYNCSDPEHPGFVYIPRLVRDPNSNRVYVFMNYRPKRTQ